MEKGELLLYLTTGPLLALLAIIFKVFPPKKINYFYGYRTKRSMRNQETWDVANRYANTRIIWLFIGLSAIELPLYLFIKAETAALTSCGLLVVGLVGLVIATENYLKDKFD